jgi:hypothetical protein
MISSSERYTSNLYMTNLPHQDNWITKVSPGVNFGIRNEDAQLTSNFTFNQLFYTNQSSLDINEQLFSRGYNHRKDRWQWGLDGSFNNQSSLSSSISNQGTVLGGFTLKQVMVKQLNLSPSLSYALSELSSITLNYNYTQATFDKNISSFLSDYDYQQASGTYNYLYNVNNKLNFTLSGSLYHKPMGSNNSSLQSLDYSLYTNNDQASVGWQHSFPQQWVSYLSVGLNYSQSDLTSGDLIQRGSNLFVDPLDPFNFSKWSSKQHYSTKSTTGVGQIYQASIQKSFEQASITLVGSQNQTPTTQGLQTQTQISVNSSYTINERLNAGLSASYAMFTMPTNINGNSLSRDYSSISPSINWHWTPELNVGLSYTYREQIFKNNISNAQDNSLLLQLTYQPQINNQVK